MLFLMGLHHVVSAVFAWDSRFFLVRQMTHVAWQGFSQRDLVFPLFLFIAGLSLPFSLAAQRARGRTTRAIVCGIVRRGLVLTCLGLLCSGVLSKPLDEVVWGTVLGQIGFAWGVAALLSLATGWRARAGVVLAAAGFAADAVGLVPVVKKMWTPAFVLVAGRLVGLPVRAAPLAIAWGLLVFLYRKKVFLEV